MAIQSHFIHTMSLIGAGVLYKPVAVAVAVAGSFQLSDALAYLPPTLLGVAAVISAVSGAIDSRAKRAQARAETDRKDRESEAARRPPPGELVA